eukprot:symbB.v1.2.025403.t1/scaffold2455.1/size78842/2
MLQALLEQVSKRCQEEGAAAILLGLAAGLNLRQASLNSVFLQLVGFGCALSALFATSRLIRRDWKRCCLSLGLLANVSAVLSLMDEHVVIEVIYVLGFREGLWHLLGLILCAFCISANFVGLALLPGQVFSSSRSLDTMGAAAWIDLEARSPVPVWCISLSIRWSVKLTLLTATGSSLIAGFYVAMHPKVEGVLPLPVGICLALLPPLLTALGAISTARAWTTLMNLSVRTRLARRTFAVALFGAVALLTAWVARLLELQSNWTSCENLLSECSALANRGDCDAGSEYFDYMMEHCKKACRACAMSHWGLGGDLLLVLHTTVVVQTLRFVFLFHQSTMQLVMADHLTEPETPFQALEENNGNSTVKAPWRETELVDATARGSGLREAQQDPNDVARSLLSEHVEADADHDLPRVRLEQPPVDMSEASPTSPASCSGALPPMLAVATQLGRDMEAQWKLL